MLIKELDTPITRKNGEKATHSITLIHNGITVTVYVDVRMAWLFERAIEFGEQRAKSKMRELLNPVLWNMPE